MLSLCTDFFFLNFNCKQSHDFCFTFSLTTGLEGKKEKRKKGKKVIEQFKVKQESTRAEPGMESRPELASHCKKEDKGKNVYNEIEPKKTHLSGNDDGCKNNEKGAQENAENKEKNDKNGTFWTVCPYCYYMYEYEKAFEEFCLRCQNCRRAFHGVAVVEPNKNMLVEGRDEYYSGLGYFVLKYSLKRSKKKKESGDEGKTYNVGEVVEISDDSDEDDGGGVNVKSGNGAKEDVLKGNVKGVMQESGNTEVINEEKRVVARKNVKSVPRNSKKVMGRGMKIRKIDGGSVRGSGTGETDLEFIEKDGDVYVGVKSIFDG